MNGILVVNKPKQCTSHDVVAKVRKIMQIKKVGHTGTLDPNATGVLPLLIGEGTKLSQYLIEHDKEYEVILKLGIKTDTADAEGKILQEDESFSLNKNTEREIEDILQSLIGKQEQMPPMYSAIKVKGKKLYEYAREGKEVIVNPRKIEIYDMKLLQIKQEQNEIVFKVHCSKGTYIRSLCEDIAKRLQTIGYMKELNRTRVGKFKIEDSVTLKTLEEDKKALEENIITIQEFFKENEIIQLPNETLIKFLNGVKIEQKKENGLYQIYCGNKYIGIGKIDNHILKREIIITQF